MAEPGSSERRDWPTAVVVGAGGLAMAVARRLGQSHRLIVADRDADHVARQCALLRGEGHDAHAVACDVTQPADVARLAGEAAARPRLRTLANVVGLSPAARDFHAILAVNLVGAAGIAAAFRDKLMPGGVGIFISSSAAHMRPLPAAVVSLVDAPLRPDVRDAMAAALGEEADAATAYMISKAGLNRLCVREAASWGARGLRIVSLSPGLIATPQGAESYRHSAGKKALFDAVPLGRECSMLEIAGVVDFLASDAASYITGTDILVDGGLIAAVRSGL